MKALSKCVLNEGKNENNNKKKKKGVKKMGREDRKTSGEGKVGGEKILNFLFSLSLWV